jgi:hypothetical protein
VALDLHATTANKQPAAGSHSNSSDTVASQVTPNTPSLGVRVWVVYLTPKIERIIVLLSASPEGEARLPMPKGMAYKE